MKHVVRDFILWLIIPLLSQYGWSQYQPSNEENLFYQSYKPVKYYSGDFYNAHPQNWMIRQDNRGVLFIANQEGIIEFDGVSWKINRIPNRVVKSLDIDSHNTLFVGGENEFGFLDITSGGEFEYVSLSKNLENKWRNFGLIYQVLCTKDATWFRSRKAIFRYKDENVIPWFNIASTNAEEFRILFPWNNYLYGIRPSSGIIKITDKPNLGIPFFNVALRSYKAIIEEKEDFLIGTRQDGLFKYSKAALSPFSTEADDYMKTNELCHAISLSNGDYALGTTKGGLLILGNNGKTKAIYNRSSLLQEDDVKNVFEDRTGNIWLALGNGIFKIHYTAPVSIFDTHSGLKGLNLSVTRYKGILYVGTSRGLFRSQTQEEKKPGAFLPVDGISVHCECLLPLEDMLLAGTSEGIYTLQNITKTSLLTNAIRLCTVMIPLQRHPGLILVGTGEGLKALRNTNGKWTPDNQFKIATGAIRSLFEDKDGHIWLSTTTGGVMHLILNEKGEPLSNDSYTSKNNLPPGEIIVSSLNQCPAFCTEEGLFRFDKNRQRFYPDNLLGNEFCDRSRNIFRLVEGPTGNIWFHSGLINYHASFDTGRKTVKVENVSLEQIPKTQINFIYDEGNHVWFAGSGCLAMYDLRQSNQSLPHHFNALIRNISSNKGTLIYGGNPGKKSSKKEAKPLELQYKDNDITFETAVPFFDDETRTMYQYFLEGYEHQWPNQWKKEPVKVYTNLDVGFYKFHVKAQNLYRMESTQDTFRFRILPPWYRTWWAFLIYLAAAGMMMYSIVKWRSLKLEMEKRRLEKIVKDRTREINHANERLKEMDKLKSRFFANISHEFRTPLTLIMGPLEQMRDEADAGQAKRKFEIIHRNAQRLLGLINQLLDLSKLESGKMTLRAMPLDLVHFIKALIEPFEIAVKQYGLTLVSEYQTHSIPLYFDPDKIEKVITNLIFNGLKFTPPGGKITVSVFTEEKPDSKGKPIEWACIAINDTGIGIPPQQLDQIFDRFYQGGAPVEKFRKGSGIGLALSKELTQLHHGDITVSSKVGVDSGTQFVVRLPMGKDHLLPRELVEEPLLLDTTQKIDAQLNPELLQSFEETTAPEDMESIASKDSPKEEIEKPIILVIEDNTDLRYYIRSSLESDYKVIEAKDGKEGLDMAMTIIPDLVITDIMMPEPDGYQVCKTLKTHMNTSHIPVVMLTAKTSEESIVQGFQTGADDYITKPFSTRALSARIKNLIELRRSLQLHMNRELVLQPTQIKVSEIDREFLADLKKVIEKNISEPELNVEHLSKLLFMSRTTVYRKILALTGVTPTDFIRSYRLKKAAQLLKSGNTTITEVAFEVGFSSRAYFTKCFKEQFQQLPSDLLS